MNFAKDWRFRKMPKKSVFSQIVASPVDANALIKSPRHWNCGMIEHEGRLWMTYRFHRNDPTGRCATAIVEIDKKSLQPRGENQILPLSCHKGDEHHEDARLFIFSGHVFVSWTRMQGYIPGINYTCQMMYAKLLLRRGKWIVLDEWCPQYGQNNGFSKEKNWVFFEHNKKLMCIYATDPEHVVLEIEGNRIVREYRTPGPKWQWGHMRGGTPPVDMGDGRMLCIFHSSIPTEIPPHYVRYYAAAYTFENKPPFRSLQISEQPILGGSEEDGHRVDPRYTEGWKPYVVFPCGLVPDGNEWLVSFGINDWQCAIGRISSDQLMLGSLDGSGYRPRFFRIQNGTLPVRYVDALQRPVFIHWEVVNERRGCAAGTGYLRTAMAREAVEVSEQPGVVEITESEYHRAKNRANILSGQTRDSR